MALGRRARPGARSRNAGAVTVEGLESRALLSATVVGRHLFYDGSAFDTVAAAGDKQALLPGQTATAANVTSYSKGINGVVIDVAGLPAPSLTADDFQFRAANGDRPARWRGAVRPAVSVRPAEGDGGSDRVSLTWPDGAIKNKWLQVKVLANTRTGLARPDLFYFGSAVGETFNGTTGNFRVDSQDVARTRNAQPGPAGPASPYDHNRDGRVTTRDLATARNNQGFALHRLAAPPDPGDAVMNLEDALADTVGMLRGGQPADVLVLGDSLSFKPNSSYLPDFRTLMQAEYGNGGPGYQHFAGAPTFSGNYTPGALNGDNAPHHAIDGLWMRSNATLGYAYLDPAGPGPLTLQYLAQPGGGSVLVFRQEGGRNVPIQVLDTGAAAPEVRTWDYTPPAGNRRMFFEFRPDGPVTMLGLNNTATPAGTAGPGLRIHRGANGGWGVDNFLRRDFTFDRQAALLGTDLFLVFIGQNDQERYTRAAYAERLNLLVDRLRAAVPDAEVVLVGTPDNGSAPLANMVGATRDVAAARGLGFVSLYDLGGNINDERQYTSDGIHFTPEGGRYVADLLFDQFQAAATPADPAAETVAPARSPIPTAPVPAKRASRMPSKLSR